MMNFLGSAFVSALKALPSLLVALVKNTASLVVNLCKNTLVMMNFLGSAFVSALKALPSLIIKIYSYSNQILATCLKYTLRSIKALGEQIFMLLKSTKDLSIFLAGKLGDFSLKLLVLPFAITYLASEFIVNTSLGAIFFGVDKLFSTQIASSVFATTIPFYLTAGLTTLLSGIGIFWAGSYFYKRSQGFERENCCKGSEIERNNQKDEYQYRPKISDKLSMFFQDVVLDKSNSGSVNAKPT